MLFWGSRTNERRAEWDFCWHPQSWRWFPNLKNLKPETLHSVCVNLRCCFVVLGDKLSCFVSLWAESSPAVIRRTKFTGCVCVLLQHPVMSSQGTVGSTHSLAEPLCSVTEWDRSSRGRCCVWSLVRSALRRVCRVKLISSYHRTAAFAPCCFRWSSNNGAICWHDGTLTEEHTSLWASSKGKLFYCLISTASACVYCRGSCEDDGTLEQLQVEVFLCFAGEKHWLAHQVCWWSPGSFSAN